MSIDITGKPDLPCPDRPDCSNAAKVLTVSVRERAAEGLYYSVPTEISRDGAGTRHLDGLAAVQGEIQATRERLLAALASIP